MAKLNREGLLRYVTAILLSVSYVSAYILRSCVVVVRLSSLHKEDNLFSRDYHILSCL